MLSNGITEAYNNKEGGKVGVLNKRFHNHIIETHKKKTEKWLKDRLIKDARILFESKKCYFGPEEIESAFDRNCTTYIFNGERDNELPLNEYLEIIKLYI